MKRILFYLSALVAVTSVWAQQDQQYTQYMANQYTINPAVAGTEDFIDVKLGFRTQWVGFDAAPKTMYLTAHSTIGKQFSSSHGHHKGEHGYWHGIGGYIYSDQTGPISRNGFYGTYAFNTAIAKKMRLSVGAAFGIKQFNFDPNGYRKNIVDNGDQLIEGAYNEVIPDLNLGFWLYNKDFYFGVSAYQMLNSEVSFEGIYEDGHNGNFTKYNSHYYATGGIMMPLSDQLTFVPSLMLKYVTPSPVSLDINGKLMFDDRFWGGLSYRVGDAFALIAGVVVKNKLEISYSYDVTTSAIRQFSSGSHEVIIGYRFQHPKTLDCPTNYWSKKKW
jgi:type IX secretion system PorP/SprF family membrane protein